MQNWSGRCFHKVEFEIISTIPESCLDDVGVPLLCCTEMECLKLGKIFDLSGVFILLCTFQDLFKGSLFCLTDSGMKIFLKNAILSIAKNNDSIEVSRNI